MTQQVIAAPKSPDAGRVSRELAAAGSVAPARPDAGGAPRRLLAFDFVAATFRWAPLTCLLLSQFALPLTL